MFPGSPFRPITTAGKRPDAIGRARSSGWGFSRVLWPFRGGEGRSAAPDAGPFWREPRLARLEAVLFVGREPLGGRKIAQLASLADGTEVRTLVRRLNRLYDDAGSSFRVEELAGGYRLLTRPMFGPWLRRALQSPVETRLSAPAMETLAVVAYRQPILRAEIESIRGVQCGDILRQLMERELVRIVGRSEDLGRPLVYGTTKRFLELFGLRHLEELPRADQLRYSGSRDESAHEQRDETMNENPGAGRGENTLSPESSPEEESVTTCISLEALSDEQIEGAVLAAPGLAASSLAATQSNERAAIDDDDDEDADDEDDWDDEEDEEDEEDDDFVDDDWEEVDDDDDDDDEEDEDEEWEDDDEDDWDDEDDEDWDDDED